jgi:hypothetical protein
MEGQSMGGAIVTHLAESRPDRFHGAVALGAALQVRDPMASLELSHQPKIPILFLSNRSEVEGPRTYAAKAAEGPVPPVVWSVDRDGHVNINQAERLLALEALINWIASDRIPTEREVTVEIELDQTATLEAGQATGRVIDITHNHGNVFINFRPGDFEHIGIGTGDRFNLTVGQVTVDVHYGTTFSDVPVGDWIAFPTAEGDTIVAINFGNAFEQLNPSIGDPATIRPIADSRRAGGSPQ